MDRRNFLKLTLTVGGGLAVAACSGRDLPGTGSAPSPTPSLPSPAPVTAPAPRPTLRLASPETGFPSPFAYGPGTHALVLLIHDTLLVRTADGGFTGWLATSLERSDDGRAYTFQLREGARWHDGRPVTAQDVAFSFSYFQAHAEELPPTVLFRPRTVTGVETTGPRTGAIRLAEPWVAFPGEVAARFPIVPRHVWEGVARPTDVTDPAQLVGCGPYRLTDYDPVRGAYLFEANDDFWLDTPFVERLEMQQVANELMALRAGDIDAGQPSTGTPTKQVLPVFEQDPRFGVVSGDPSFFAALSWNAGLDGPPGEVAFRRACAHAINRPDLLSRVVGPGTPGNPGFLPPHHPAHHDVEGYPHDPGRAEVLLEEAGYPRPAGGGPRRGPDGQPLKLTLLTFPELAPTAQLVRDALGRVGIDLEFQPTDFFTAVTTGALNSYQMALLFFGGLERDADLLREYFSSRTEGQGLFHALGWKNREFDRLAEAQKTTLDPAERQPLLAHMQEILADQLPMLPLYYATPFLMYRRGVFDQWSLDVEHKQIYVTGKADGQPPIRPIAEA